MLYHHQPSNPIPIPIPMPSLNKARSLQPALTAQYTCTLLYPTLYGSTTTTTAHIRIASQEQGYPK